MITLVFVICLGGGVCVQQAPEQVFTSVDHCELAANEILDRINRQVASGQIPPHRSMHKCINWGTAS